MSLWKMATRRDGDELRLSTGDEFTAGSKLQVVACRDHIATEQRAAYTFTAADEALAVIVRKCGSVGRGPTRSAIFLQRVAF
jgi:hypothetical protein